MTGFNEESCCNGLSQASFLFRDKIFKIVIVVESERSLSRNSEFVILRYERLTLHDLIDVLVKDLIDRDNSLD